MDEKHKLQGAILIIAREIDRICRDNNIKYFMDGGTQLGAVRHNGFIPWDDDFDIGMRRSEFERFVEVCRISLDSRQFYLETVEDEGYGFSFAKVHLNNTEIVEDFSKNVKVHHGIFVDVFPYDNLPDASLNRRIFLAENHILKNMIWVKAGYGDDAQKKRMTFKIFNVMSKMIPLSNLKKKRETLIRKYNDRETQYCFTSDYPQNWLQCGWLDDLVQYQFETDMFWGMRNYDEFLHMLYGNYMNLPPIEKRVAHSNYRIIFGPY